MIQCTFRAWNCEAVAGQSPIKMLSGLIVMTVIGLVTVPAIVFAQAKPSTTAQLIQRIEQLEEQIVDMQVVIGTFQSLPRGEALPRGAASARVPSGFGAGMANDGARLDGMETQIRALTAQIAQISAQVRNMNAGAGGGRRGALENGGPQQLGQTGAPPAQFRRPNGQQPTGAVTGFGSTTVVQPGAATPDPIGGFLQKAPDGQQTLASRDTGGTQNRSDPKKLYETAYGYLLQQQYGAAETAFKDFVNSHPNDPLAGNAQYWLGESFFLRGQYKPAANAFLKGYETFGKSNKAPDSLLKLAMSFDRLGHKDAACSSLSELNTRFPRAPAYVKKRALNERKRVGC